MRYRRPPGFLQLVFPSLSRDRFFGGASGGATVGIREGAGARDDTVPSNRTFNVAGSLQAAPASGAAATDAPWAVSVLRGSCARCASGRAPSPQPRINAPRVPRPTSAYSVNVDRGATPQFSNMCHSPSVCGEELSKRLLVAPEGVGRARVRPTAAPPSSLISQRGKIILTCIACQLTEPASFEAYHPTCRPFSTMFPIPTSTRQSNC